jgi:hypothetical protein
MTRFRSAGRPKSVTFGEMTGVSPTPTTPPALDDPVRHAGSRWPCRTTAIVLEVCFGRH